MKQFLPILLGVGATVIGTFVVMKMWRSRARVWLDEDDLDEIDLASDHSFPASDPPSWTGTTSAPIR